MNILICDDDKLYIDMIRKYVDEFFADHKITDYKVYEYNSGDYNQLCICTYYRSYNIVDEYVADV